VTAAEPAAPAADDPRVQWHEDVLRFRDTDANRHVNNTTFSEFCESGRVRFFRERLRTGPGPARYFVVVRFAIDYRAELHYPGTVRTGTWLAALGRTSVTFRQRVLAEDGGLAADATSVCVQMDAATRRPLPFDDADRAAIAALMVVE
jgi:acyl-CoA thioester hydrolase